jgi:hypothetical protein
MVIIILDAPGSGALLDAVQANGGPANVAWVAGFDGAAKSDEDARVGAFTFALAEALFHGDANGDGFVSFQEAKGHATARLSGALGLDPRAVNGELLRRAVAGRGATPSGEGVKAKLRMSEPLRIVREGNKSYLESAHRGRLKVRVTLVLPQGPSGRLAERETAFLGFGFSERWTLANAPRARKGPARVSVQRPRSRPELRLSFSFSKRNFLAYLRETGVAERLLDGASEDVTLEMPMLVAAPDSAGVWSVRVPVRFTGARAVIRGRH